MSLTLDNVTDDFSIVSSDSIVKKEKLINKFARVTQCLTWPVLYAVFHLFFRIRMHGSHNFDLVRSPFMIISNHISFYDSFIFRLALGCFSDHLPLRFMAVRRFDWRFLNLMARAGIIDLVYSLFGVFTVVPGLGMSQNLKRARDIIEAGGNIVIYPEGKIFQEGGVGQFKKGAAVLMKQTDISIIPVSFRLGKRKWFRRELYVNVGGPMNMMRDRAVEEITRSFHKHVERLYERESWE